MRWRAVAGNLRAVNSRYLRFLLLFAALWLPVQTMAGLAMSQCRHAQDRGDPAFAVAAPDASATPCHEAGDVDQTAHQEACDNCEMCHLASAGFMPSADLLTGLIRAENHYVLPATIAPPSHIAEPPQHPPRSVA